MSAGRRDLFAVLHWTEPQLRSAPQWYIFAMLHLRSGTSSQCSSGQSHIPVVHLRSAPQWCIFAVVHLRSAPVDRATFQWYIFAVLRQSHIPVVHLHSAPFRLLFFFFFRLLFFFFFLSDFFSFSFFSFSVLSYPVLSYSVLSYMGLLWPPYSLLCLALYSLHSLLCCSRWPHYHQPERTKCRYQAVQYQHLH